MVLLYQELRVHKVSYREQPQLETMLIALSKL